MSVSVCVCLFYKTYGDDLDDVGVAHGQVLAHLLYTPTQPTRMRQDQRFDGAWWLGLAPSLEALNGARPLLLD